jgi:O-succinylhomoserine sulfhydrylase
MKRRPDPSRWRAATKAVRGGTQRTENFETSEALFLNSGFTYESAESADARFAGTEPGFVYSRYGNPTLSMLEARLALLEGAEMCLLASSGMAAISASMLAVAQRGDRIVAAKALFGSCRWVLETLAPRYGIEVDFVDGWDLGQWEAACRRPVRLALLETPANPMLDGVDIRGVSDLVRRAGGLTIVDNVFASPVLQKPLDHGADIVVYSATKHMDGQGRVLGGAILGSRALLMEHYFQYLRHTGPALAPFNAWVILKGLETIDLRVRAMSANAARVADALAAHRNVERLFYPGRADHPHHDVHARQMLSGGTLIAFDVAMGQEGAFKFLNALQIIDISNNLGDAKSLATHPETTTHRSMSEAARREVGVTPGTLRLSVGLEDAEDLVEDVLAALELI